jgi:hypothetical protein
MSARDLLLDRIYRNNVFVETQRLQRIQQSIVAPEVVLNALDELTPDIGLATIFELRAGNNVEPGSGFTGIRYLSDGVDDGNGNTVHLLGVSNDVVQSSISAGDGKIRDGAGNTVIDASGVTIPPSATPNGSPVIAAHVGLFNLSSDVGSTNLANTSVAGTYLVLYKFAVTTGDGAAGGLSWYIEWTDDTGATSEAGGNSLTFAGKTSGRVYVQLSSGNISYRTTHSGSYGSSKYSIYIDVLRLS